MNTTKDRFHNNKSVDKYKVGGATHIPYIRLKSLCMIVLIISVTFLTLYMSDFRDFFKCLFVKMIGVIGESGDNANAQLKCYAEYWGELLWALTASDVAFIIFYYSAMNQMNYGISHRMINAYLVGSFFIPILLLSMFILSVLTVLMLFLKRYAEFYLLSIWTLTLQFMIVFCCISVTSRGMCRRMILKVERKQYIAMREFASEKEDHNGKISLRYDDIRQMEKNLPCHIESIAGSKETLNEKMKIIAEILNIPFESSRVVFSEGDFCGLKIYIKKNLRFPLLSARTFLTEAESQALFSMIYMIVSDRCREYLACKQNEIKRVRRMELLLFMGCIFQLLISKKRLGERWTAINYIINEFLNMETIRPMSIGMLLLVIYVEEQAGHALLIDKDFNCAIKEQALDELSILEEQEQEDLCTAIFIFLSGTTETVKRKTIYRMVYQLFNPSSHSIFACRMSYLRKTAKEARNETCISV